MSSGNFKEVQEGITKALVDTTRTAGQLAGEDLVFYRSLNPSLRDALDHQNRRLLGLARDLTRAAVAGTELPVPQISDVDTLDDEWMKVVDVVDNLLERADASLDEFSGVVKKPTLAQEEQAKQAAGSPPRISRSQRIVKPQLQFAHAPTNHDISPFKPLLKSKPHALTSLEQSLTLIEREDGSKQYTNPPTAKCHQ